MVGRRERGATAIEYLGVVVVVVLLISTLTLTKAGTLVGAYVHQGICSVGSLVGGECSPDAPRREDAIPDYEPDQCTVSTSGTTHKVDVSIAIVDAGGTHGVRIAEVRHADGTTEYIVTKTGEGRGGLGIGIGGKGETGEGNGGADIGGDLGISGSYTNDTAYRVDSLEEARSLQDRLISNPFNTDGLDPITETVTWGGKLEGSIDLGLGLPENGTPENGGAIGGDDEGGELGGGGKLEGAHSYATTTNYETGETTYITNWSGEVSANADALEGINASGTWKGSTSVAITRDANGQIVSIKLMTQTQAGSTLKIGGKEASGSGREGVDVITTVSLPVDDTNRSVVEDFLGSADRNYAGLLPLQTMFWDPTQSSSDPMVNLLYNQAQITEVSMANSSNTWQLGGEIKWGIKLGATYTYTDTEGNVVDAQYAGAPAGGQRPWHNMEVCFG